MEKDQMADLDVAGCEESAEFNQFRTEETAVMCEHRNAA
jgi:hypothetical protein